MAQKTPQSARYHAAMPNIPGVPSGSRAALLKAIPPAIAVSLGALLLIGLGLAFRHYARSASATKPAIEVQAHDPSATSPAVPNPRPAPLDRAEAGEIAPVSDLSRPWSSKTFTYVHPIVHVGVPAMVIRLPGAAAGSSSSYWAFSLTEPFGTCQLQYVTDLSALASQYGYTATHPMVVDPCTQTVFDPLRMGQRTDGAWVRGEIVQGGGIRPPMAIEVTLRDGTLYADRIE
jgi:hypothetical protein